MTTLIGVASLPVLHLASHYTVSANLRTVSLARVPSIAGLDRAGTRRFTLAGVLPRAGWTGAADRTFRDDWYHRIHVLPAAIDFGNIVSPVSHPIEVWNAFFSPVSLAAIEVAGADGLSLTGQPPPPLVYGGLKSRVYTVAASTQGSPVLSARYVFRFSNGATSKLTVSGRRVVVFGFGPNWAGGITERLAWLTDVLESYDGSEQRVRLRSIPRRSFEFQLDLAGHDVRVLETLLHAWAARVFAVPVWTDRTVLTAPLSPGATAVRVSDAANADYHAGGLVAFWSDNQHHEVGEILSLAGNALTLKEPLSRGWPAGTRVFPARFARLDGDVVVAHTTDALASARVRFEVEDPSPMPGIDGPTDYQGYRVLEWPPNRIDDVTDTWRRKLATLDYGTGPVTLDDLSGHPVVGKRLRFTFCDRATIQAFRAWLHARLGRAVPFWLSSDQSDAVLTRPIHAADQHLTVRNLGYARYLASPMIRRDVAIRVAGGSVYLRRITGATEISEDEELLTIDSTLGVTLAVQDVLRISFLNLVRLEADAQELFWETDGIVQAVLEVRTVKE
ncbi:MAG: hypothetical protein V5B35_09550 [Candidatus Accumulibacter necessarius]|jgi:hypothetical protein